MRGLQLGAGACAAAAAALLALSESTGPEPRTVRVTSGDWLIVCSGRDGVLHLVDGSSGATLLLPWSAGHGEPTIAPPFIEP